MAYPFIKFPTFAEFIQRLRSHDIILGDLDEPLVKDENTQISVHYLEGTVKGKVMRRVIDIVDFDDRVTPSVLRSICTQFDLDLESFSSGQPTAGSDEEGRTEQH